MPDGVTVPDNYKPSHPAERRVLIDMAGVPKMIHPAWAEQMKNNVKPVGEMLPPTPPYFFGPLSFAAAEGDYKMILNILTCAGGKKIEEDGKLYHGCAPHPYLPNCIEAAIPAEQCLKERDAQGNCPLHHAAIYGHVECGKLLIEGGFKVDDRTFGDYTPLHKAYYNDRMEFVEMLLAAGADPNAKNKKGEIPSDLKGMKVANLVAGKPA